MDQPTSDTLAPVRRGPSDWPERLYDMLEDTKSVDIVHWNEAGNGFIIVQPGKIREPLRKYFQTDKKDSLYRSCHNYAFTRVKDVEHVEWVHPCFTRLDRARAVSILRKCAGGGFAPPQTAPAPPPPPGREQAGRGGPPPAPPPWHYAQPFIPPVSEPFPTHAPPPWHVHAVFSHARGAAPPAHSWATATGGGQGGGAGGGGYYAHGGAMQRSLHSAGGGGGPPSLHHPDSRRFEAGGGGSVDDAHRPPFPSHFPPQHLHMGGADSTYNDVALSARSGGGPRAWPLAGHPSPGSRKRSRAAQEDGGGREGEDEGGHEEGLHPAAAAAWQHAYPARAGVWGGGYPHHASYPHYDSERWGGAWEAAYPHSARSSVMPLREPSFTRAGSSHATTGQTAAFRRGEDGSTGAGDEGYVGGGGAEDSSSASSTSLLHAEPLASSSASEVGTLFGVASQQLTREGGPPTAGAPGLSAQPSFLAPGGPAPPRLYNHLGSIGGVSLGGGPGGPTGRTLLHAMLSGSSEGEAQGGSDYV